VSIVTSGEEAIEYLDNDAVDLLLLDMLMEPGMDGYQTFKQIRANNPQQKAVIASGFSESSEVKKTQALGAGAYLKKPYTLRELGHAVKKELQG
ncbi:MAG: response regulator transcription factor, partial [Desulfuromonadales bacterium]|nr:response regulator transcription factor [Desulfuromonadales bacterium]